MRARLWVGSIMAVAAMVALTYGLAPRASAATASANLTVTATVTNNCSITTTPVAFGAYDPVVVNAEGVSTAGAVATTGPSGAGATGACAKADPAHRAVNRRKVVVFMKDCP